MQRVGRGDTPAVLLHPGTLYVDRGPKCYAHRSDALWLSRGLARIKVEPSGRR